MHPPFFAGLATIVEAVVTGVFFGHNYIPVRTSLRLYARGKMNFSNKVTLITGGAGGIGVALARALLKEGARIVICDLDAARLEAARAIEPRLHAIQCDITSDADIARLEREIVTAYGGLDVLINNAASGVVYNFVTDGTALEKAERDVRTNLIAPLTLIKRFLPHLERSAEAAIVNVSSDLANVPYPAKSTYCATKAALHSFTISLRTQLSGTRIRVIEIQPPVVDTERTRGYDTSTRTLNTLFQGEKMQPRLFAEKVLRAMKRGDIEVRIGRSQLTYLMSRFFPMTTRRILSRD